MRLAIVGLDAPVENRLWDLDDPGILVQRKLRPSEIATRRRETTRVWAANLFRARPHKDGIRWWSILEATWMHVTFFHRALSHVSIGSSPQPLRLDVPVVRHAAQAMGIRLDATAS